ncbi:MAG: hypothetical protein O3A96_15450 [Proteobacteria bacterium]|nr:hypothetical protein [Pseudomonadota bacterium]
MLKRFRLSRRKALSTLPLLALALLLSACPKPLPEGSKLLRDRSPGYPHQ